MRPLGLFCSLLIFAYGAVAANNPEPSIVPAAQQWIGDTGTLDLHGAPIVISEKDEKLLRPTVELMSRDLAAIGYPTCTFAAKGPLSSPLITFAFTYKPFNAGTNVIEDQSYRLTIETNGVTITAHNRAGIFYGTRSLLQMLASGKPLPCG